VHCAQVIFVAPAERQENGAALIGERFNAKAVWPIERDDFLKQPADPCHLAAFGSFNLPVEQTD
jgi:hypothetical protein